MDALDLTLTVVVGGTIAALLMGLSKTGLPPLGALGAAIIASVLPPVQAAGVALPLLIVGDLVAVSTYGRDVRWRILRGLLPSVTVGLLVGFAALRWAPPEVSARIVGALLLLAGLGELVRQLAAHRARRRPPRPADAEPDVGSDAEATPGATRASLRDRLARATLGATAGVSTMIANAGGPPMSLYLLRTGVSRAGLLGTVALFFLTVNVAKLPFSASLGLVSADSLLVSLALLPGMVAGLLLGRVVAHRISGPVFSTAVLIATALAGARLLLG
ncbi:sulfite exporter TauE/SafE family protein [Promicromonospora sukumoe]|uniref:sulfite exporter TauE/SafE family protein n=1 Tax=Promicromonospora sukumoe TaxID=88382 RepID=UPI00036DC062|nr:sulfite exporter TauE/SafE family protein [Promicromonospora sukumoe]